MQENCTYKSRSSQPSESVSSLPCLNSNNYTETSFFTPSTLTPYHRKQAYSLIENCDRFIKRCGINHVGFLTLTFPDNVLDHSAALKRWNSLRTHFIDEYFGEWMLVKERQSRGAIHYHILIEVPFDIRSGFNFDQVFPPKGQRPDYSSASNELKRYWKLLRDNLPKYGFGRSELAPIRSNGEAMAKYVGKYVSKNVKGRKASKYDALDKGARMFAYSQSWARSNTKFGWNSPGAKEWRRKVKKFAHFYNCNNEFQLSLLLGKQWAYRFYAEIMEVDRIVDEVNRKIPF